MRKVFLGNDARERLLVGAKELYEAVSVTLSPRGQNAILSLYSTPTITHDGVTVAKAVDIEETEETYGAKVGVELIRQAASKTNDTAGDGTTTATILAYHLLKGGHAKIVQGKNPMVLRKELEQAAEAVLNHLSTLATPVKDNLKDIATISAENDKMGEVVAEVFTRLGKDALVTVEVSPVDELGLEIVEGYSFERGYLSPYMITELAKRTAEYDNPLIAITKEKIGVPEVAPLIEEMYQAGKSELVLIADEFTPELLATLALNRTRYKVLGIKTPGFGEGREAYLDDIAALTGATILSGDDWKTPDLAKLGSCQSVVSSADKTVLIGTKLSKEYIKGLESQVNTASQYQKSVLNQRIALLKGKAAVIRVGGVTEMKANERKDLIDDAIASTRAALVEGVVPGGATTLVELSRNINDDSDGADLLKGALLEPFKTLMKNTGEPSSVKLTQITQFGKGFDVAHPDELVDLVEKGIIDPALVLKEAITNAVAVAGDTLTMGTLIVDVPEKEKPDA